MRLTLGASRKENERDRRNAVHAVAHAGKLACMLKRLRVSVFVVPAPRWCDAKQPSMCMSQQYCNHAHQGGSFSCGRASSMASTLPSTPLSIQVARHALHALIRLSPSPAPVALDAAAAIHRRRKIGGDRNCSQRHSDGRY